MGTPINPTFYCRFYYFSLKKVCWFRYYLYLYPNRIRHASRRTANQGGSFALYEYPKNIYQASAANS